MDIFVGKGEKAMTEIMSNYLEMNVTFDFAALTVGIRPDADHRCDAKE
jgi:hypothetical protein